MPPFLYMQKVTLSKPFKFAHRGHTVIEIPVGTHEVSDECAQAAKDAKVLKSRKTIEGEADQPGWIEVITENPDQPDDVEADDEAAAEKAGEAAKADTAPSDKADQAPSNKAK